MPDKSTGICCDCCGGVEAVVDAEEVCCIPAAFNEVEGAVLGPEGRVEDGIVSEGELVVLVLDTEEVFGTVVGLVAGSLFHWFALVLAPVAVVPVAAAVPVLVPVAGAAVPKVALNPVPPLGFAPYI